MFARLYKDGRAHICVSNLCVLLLVCLCVFLLATDINRYERISMKNIDVFEYLWISWTYLWISIFLTNTVHLIFGYSVAEYVSV